MSDNRQQGEQVRREVMGDAFVDRALNNATDFTQPLQDFVNEHAWGGSGPAACWSARPAA